MKASECIIPYQNNQNKTLVQKIIAHNSVQACWYRRWSGQLPCTGKSGQRKPVSHVHLLLLRSQCRLLLRWLSIGEVHLPPPPPVRQEIACLIMHLNFKIFKLQNFWNYIAALWTSKVNIAIGAWCNAYACKNFVGRTLGTSGPDWLLRFVAMAGSKLVQFQKTIIEDCVVVHFYFSKLASDTHFWTIGLFAIYPFFQPISWHRSSGNHPSTFSIFLINQIWSHAFWNSLSFPKSPKHEIYPGYLVQHVLTPWRIFSMIMCSPNLMQSGSNPDPVPKSFFTSPRWVQLRWRWFHVKTQVVCYVCLCVDEVDECKYRFTSNVLILW